MQNAPPRYNSPDLLNRKAPVGKAIAAIVALLIVSPLCLAEVPRLFREKEFTAASFAEAVNHYVALKEDAAVEELQGLALDGEKDFTKHNGAWSVNERLGWMCRVLFMSTGDKPLRPPGFGGLSLPWSTMPLESWPSYPVALSGSTYFVLSEGYTLDGLAERTEDYIKYCRKNGRFRAEPLSVPTKEQAIKDAAALRASKAWRKIKWEDSGQNWFYLMSETDAWKYIQNQADSVM